MGTSRAGGGGFFVWLLVVNVLVLAAVAAAVEAGVVGEDHDGRSSIEVGLFV